MDVSVVWNNQSGGAEAAAAVREELRRRADTEVLDALTRNEAIEAAAEAARGGARVVLAAGGDGTINAVANGLLTADRSWRPSAENAPEIPVLGILPIGSANDFARTLAVPLDPVEALRCLDAVRTRPVDVVQTGSEGRSDYFLNMATAGNSERVIAQLTPVQKERWGAMCYLRGAFDVALDMQSYEVILKLDDRPPRTHAAWNLILANGRTSAAGLPIAPRASLEDGLLDVIVVTDGTLPDLVEIGARLWLDRFLDSDLVELHRAGRVEVVSDPPLRFTADGDLIEWVPAWFEVKPAAMNVIVGPEYS